MSTSRSDYNAQIIEEFRANEGRVGGTFEGMPLLLLHHTGAKSGESRVSPVAYLRDGDRYVVFASRGGSPTNPGWYHNLRAHPHTSVEVGSEEIEVDASEAAGEERERLFSTQAQRVPQFGEYERSSGRRIPVMVLTPATRA
jgi:deazaflavin-dependent oxidoreductase (nitroreductase family)